MHGIFIGNIKKIMIKKLHVVLFSLIRLSTWDIKMRLLIVSLSKFLITFSEENHESSLVTYQDEWITKFFKDSQCRYRCPLVIGYSIVVRNHKHINYYKKVSEIKVKRLFYWRNLEGISHLQFNNIYNSWSKTRYKNKIIILELLIIDNLSRFPITFFFKKQYHYECFSRLHLTKTWNYLVTLIWL